MNEYMKRILMASLFLVFMVSYAHAENEDNEGYDENTEIRLKGEVTHVLPRSHGPVVVVLHTASKTYMVITGPPWYLAQEGFTVKVGDSLKVTGSKFIGREGNVYIAARRIKDSATGRVLLLRDSNHMPLWRGNHRMRGGGSEP
jgi:hypothetical protein